VKPAIKPGELETYFLSFLSSRVPKYAKQAMKSRKSAAKISPSFPIVDPLSEGLKVLDRERHTPDLRFNTFGAGKHRLIGCYGKSK